MKKLKIAIVLLLACATVLGGCDTSAGVDTDTDTETEKETQTESIVSDKESDTESASQTDTEPEKDSSADDESDTAEEEESKTEESESGSATDITPSETETEASSETDGESESENVNANETDSETATEEVDTEEATDEEEEEDDGSGMTFPSETNAFVDNFYIDATDQDSPFFETILPAIKANIKKNNKHSITPYYDKFPLANNPENFQGLGSTTYENINGKTVRAEAFYRLKDESLCDPNAGMGLLIYQCIQYKLAHPEENVKITFSSYRTSVTASVCVLPESKYYGYMRSLYGTNYDEHGFVRISYMLVEAARMGIEVTMVNQLPSYGVNQYNPNLGKLKYRNHLDFKVYFKKALATDCYDKYAEGKKVSDFLNCVNTEWTVTEQTANMQHVKSASVSHYLATDGTEHTSAVFFSSANLDENNYIGANGNNNAQSGVIISNHDELYRVTYNYMMLMAKYSYQEGLQELRDVVAKMNEEQIALINAGRGNEIPLDQQIVYLGTESDKIFELYFTPLGGAVDSWDTVHNPISKYASKLPSSEGYIEFVWNEYGYGKCYLGYALSKTLEAAFCNHPDPDNKISIKVTGFDTSAIKKLEKGTEIGYRDINAGLGVHAKDLMMSYVEDGKRHYVCIMTSCNYYMIAFNYRTNSILVINETEETGGEFYKIFGDKYSYGMITKD